MQHPFHQVGQTWANLFRNSSRWRHKEQKFKISMPTAWKSMGIWILWYFSREVVSDFFFLYHNLLEFQNKTWSSLGQLNGWCGAPPTFLAPLDFWVLGFKDAHSSKLGGHELHLPSQSQAPNAMKWTIPAFIYWCYTEVRAPVICNGLSYSLEIKNMRPLKWR